MLAEARLVRDMFGLAGKEATRSTCGRGGGAGILVRTPGQTLPDHRLHLTEGERKDLRAFLCSLTYSLTDTVTRGGAGARH
jgi:hypothetical protein